VLFIALAQAGEVIRDVLRRHRADLRRAASGESRRVALKIPPVGLQGERRQPRLDCQVIEIPVDGAGHAGPLSSLRLHSGLLSGRARAADTGAAGG